MADADGITRLNAALGGRYRIEHELGAGGMATVYLAEDVRHHRKVALKVLRPEVADALGPERFLREIETVARLTHPHVLPLHDSGEADGLLFYVMPYVEGETLRERLEREGALPVDEALRIAQECAEALGHAHDQGIIHRDLKPANVLFSGGHAVVADFGIARAVQDAADEQVLTRTGVSIGTVGYMSPEQATGERTVDERTDVYSLGCVLYEMLTGEQAFSGRTAQAVMAKQLTGDVPSARVLRPSVSGTLDAIVQRTLQPSPADRYGSVQEVGKALKELSRDAFEAIGSHRRSYAPVGGRLERDGARTGVSTRGRIVAMAGAVVVLGIVWILLTRSGPGPVVQYEGLPTSSLQGFEADPAISRDGTRVAFSWDGGSDGNTDLYVTLTAGGDPVRLSETSADERRAAWSPDGAHIAFIRDAEQGGGELRVVPSVGGQDRLVTEFEDFVHDLDWSPKGEWLAVSIGTDGVSLIHWSSGEHRSVTTPPDTAFDARLAFSPDGEHIVFSRVLLNSGSGSWGIGEIHSVSIDGGGIEQVTVPDGLIWDVGWSKSGETILFTEGPAGGPSLMQTPREGGEVSKLYVTPSPETFSVAPESDVLVYASRFQDHDVWTYPGPAASPEAAPQPRLASTRDDGWPAYSPDGSRIAFVSDRSGSLEIWTSDADGSGALQLTRTGFALHPSWSPDGTSIAFHVPSPPAAYVMPSEGGTPRLLVEGGVAPTWSRDGRWIYVQYRGLDDTWRAWRVPREGGPLQQVASEPALGPREGSDGRVYFQWGAAIRAISPGDTAADVVIADASIGLGDWWLWSDELVYATWDGTGGGSGLWTLDLVSGTRTRLGDLALLPHGRGMLGMTGTPDGTEVLVTHLIRSGADLYRVEGFEW